MAILEQLLEQHPGKINIAFKHYPLRSHAYAYKAAQAAVAAHQQGKFWPFHDMLFKQHKNLNDRRVDEISRLLKLDPSRFKMDMAAASTQARINNDLKEGRLIGVRGTPTIFINGKILRNKTLAGFKQAIARALKP